MFSAKERSTILERIANDELDILVIGGGITGAGTALDAQTRGLKTALIEMQDFASGTSSRSTKLIHGGLRYLKQFEVKLVAEVGKERAIVYENAPHVTTPLRMLLPIVKGGTFGKLSTFIGLTVYDILAGVNKDERRTMLDRAETLRKVPMLKKDGLKGSGFYVEYRTDDARLTIEVMKEAVNRGVKALNYVKAESLIYENGKVVGVHAVDQLTGEMADIKAKKIINAAGPWVDDIREMDHSKEGKQLHLTKGVHLTIDGERFPLHQSVYFDTPDGRMVFAIPREGKTYVGTTDTFYKGDFTNPRITLEDRDYVLKAVNSMFPDVNLRPEDIESGWAGVRPLIHEAGKAPSEISRKDEVFVSKSGLITIAGGKLTGYRKMAERVVSLAAKQLEEEGIGRFPKSFTKTIRLSGGDVGGSAGYQTFVQSKIAEGISLGLNEPEVKMLVTKYGSNVDYLYNRIKTNKAESTLPVIIESMLTYGIAHEMVATPSDFFIRRTGALFFNINWVKEWKIAVIDYMSTVFDWNEDEKQKHTSDLNERIVEATEYQ